MWDLVVLSSEGRVTDWSCFMNQINHAPFAFVYGMWQSDCHSLLKSTMRMQRNKDLPRATTMAFWTAFSVGGKYVHMCEYTAEPF